ncbi:MAG: multiple sugar transport system substrate-binding protein [Pseudonocardiales bacterium]|jgi:multiple sugar transport system substrate-binding protein|nr:multiple sugar transport system substrate-binding protein [Pseudonocardiales bacterium]
MNRRWAVVAVVSATTALGLAACGSSGGGSGGGNNNTLSLVAADYGTGPANTSQKYWQKIADDFHKANPKITVKVKTVNWNDFDNQVQTSVQNHQQPDITEGDYFANYAQEGLLYKASDVLSNPSNLVPVFANLGSYKGTQYGIPFTTSSRTLFYNKKLFTQAGITSAPQTWDDVKTDALKIKALGKVGFGLPLGSEEAQAETLLWMLGNGGNFKDKAGAWTIDSAQNVDTFNYLKDLVKSGATEPNPGNKNRTDLWKQFAQGGIGMINGSPALIPIIESGKVLGASDWTSVPIAGKTAPLTSTLGVCDFVAAFKNGGTKKQAAIKKFLDFAYQDKYQVQFDKEYSLLPATTSAVNSLASDTTFAPFLKALPNAVQYPSDTSWAAVKTQIQQTIGTALTGDPKKVLGTIEATAKKGS